MNTGMCVSTIIGKERVSVSVKNGRFDVFATKYIAFGCALFPTCHVTRTLFNDNFDVIETEGNIDYQSPYIRRTEAPGMGKRTNPVCPPDRI